MQCNVLELDGQMNTRAKSSKENEPRGILQAKDAKSEQTKKKYASRKFFIIYQD